MGRVAEAIVVAAKVEVAGCLNSNSAVALRPSVIRPLGSVRVSAPGRALSKKPSKRGAVIRRAPLAGGIVDWTEVVYGWRALPPEEEHLWGRERIPCNGTRGYAFSGSPADLAIGDAKPARLTAAPIIRDSPAKA